MISQTSASRGQIKFSPSAAIYRGQTLIPQPSSHPRNHPLGTTHSIFWLAGALLETRRAFLSTPTGALFLLRLLFSTPLHRSVLLPRITFSTTLPGCFTHYFARIPFSRGDLVHGWDRSEDGDLSGRFCGSSAPFKLDSKTICRGYYRD